MTAIDFLIEKLKLESIDLSLWHQNLINEAKEMERKQSHQYAEFAIRCDRMEMKILNFEDWIKL
jgi:hypothetical protein